ncbi:MAG: hypothetical protein ACJ8M4_07965 [Chthoniobacterales bacterium]
MHLKRRLLIIGLGLLGVALLFVALGPLMVATGLRTWSQRVARREGLTLEIEQIEAPLLRPAVAKNVHVLTSPGAPIRVDCQAARIAFDLNLYGILTGSRRSLRALTIEGLSIDIRRQPTTADSSRHIPWTFLENLLSDSFNFSGIRIHVENGVTTVDVRDGVVSGSEMEPGILQAGEISIAAPWFRKNFVNVKGATSWQDTRLAVGAVSLMRGLDVDTLVVDLSQIGASQIAMELNIDAFGGKVRARVSSDDRSDTRIWDMAGSASGVSLAKMSDALGWADRASGSLHSSKFTFRGAMNDIRNSTASVWAEVSGMTWRDRTADTVMVGASLYNRQVQVEHLYIKQRSNELNFDGEFAWPEKASEWIKPVFRGDISASINDLGDFARLFGEAPADFAGKLAANGNVSAEEGKLQGQLAITGNSLILFRSEIESLEMKLAVEESRLRIAPLDLRRGEDFLHAEGTIALNDKQWWTGSVETSFADIADYRGFIPETFSVREPSGSIEGEWKSAPSSGSFKIRSRNFRLGQPATLPFDAELEAEYSAATTFFRQFHFWNSRCDLSAFVTLGEDYSQVQELRFNLNGRPFVTGGLFLPISFDKMRGDAGWLRSMSTDPFFDVDLTLAETDLAEFAGAVCAIPSMSGKFGGHLQLSGTPGSLQTTAEFHARNFVTDAAPPLSADVELRQGLGIANVKGKIAAAGSDPLTFEGAFPLQLEKIEGGYALKKSGPMSGSIKFPAIVLAGLPAYIPHPAFTRGIVSGNVVVADSLEQPLVTGDLNLIDGQLLNGLRASGGLTFHGRKAAVDFAHLGKQDADFAFRGEIDFHDLSAVSATLLPNSPLAETSALLPGDCVNQVEFAGPLSDRVFSATVNQINLQGDLGRQRWTLSLSQKIDPDLEEEDPARRIFSFCRDGKTLSLRGKSSFLP